MTRRLRMGSPPAIAGLTILALGGAALMLRPDRPATVRGDVTVVPGGTAATTAPVAKGAAAPPAPMGAHRPRSPLAKAALAHATADTRVMDQATDVQPRDPRGPLIERQVETAFRARAALADARDVVVTCTVTLCEVAGMTSIDPAAARSALRSDDLLKAIAALGYSSGPDEEASREGGTAFVMYLNREV
ncbi:MAG: hypothetical protein PGN16_00075 [Sphingomonas phyllosphaerae]|uniref:hypothetical protein n=1 Tax=Sphingomonas phyllosphaerae TaxID=257003 RepID=UPI002FF6D402